MKVVIDPTLKGKELFSFLIENKSQLITQKKSMIKEADAVSFTPSFYNVKGDTATKTAIGEIPADATSVRVKVVANTSMYCDSQRDVLLLDSARKSIKDRKGMIPHLHDHVHKIEAEVGDVKSIYYQDLPLTDLGINKNGTAQVLVFETDIKKSYNERVFEKYRAGKIKQHSIGLQYSKIELAINDSEYEKEQDFWNKHINDIINKDEVEEMGYFWVISEYKLLENSCVLFGSNKLTPTLEVKTDTEIQPLESTEEQPSEKSTFEIKTLLNIFN